MVPPFNDGMNGGFSNYPIGSGGGGPSDGDYGDIVISSSGTVYTIDAGVVTFAKMANIATDRLIGRDTAGTGSPEALTVGGGIEFTGTGGIQTSAFTGDVTKSAGGTATTIPNNTVTYAKMQDMTTARVLGRTTAGSGDPEELSAGAGISISGGQIASTITQYTDELAQDAVGGILTDSSTVDFTYNDAGNTISAAVIANSSTQKIEVTKNSGAVVGTRKQLNFIEGSGATLTIADDAGNDQVDITIAVAGGGVSDGDKGDITVSGSGATFTIDNDVVTYAKMQNMTTSRLLGRTTAGSGDPEEISAGTGLSLSAGSLSVSNDTTTQKVEIVKNSGAVISTRKQLNFIEGTNVTLTIADDAGNNQTDITIAASGGGGGSATFGTVEKDLGSTPLSSGTFDITGLSSLSSGKPVIITVMNDDWTGKGTLLDECEMDNIMATAYVFDSTTIRVNWNSSTGPVKGNVKFQYLISA